MSFQFADLSKAVAADGIVSSEELLSLRSLGWGDGRIHRDEAEAIFAINRALEAPGEEWADFFVEALGEFVLNGTEPKGYIDEAEAAWLIGALDQDGRLETVAELELLVRVLERAENVPDTLKHYALKQIEAAVLTGTGATRCGGTLSNTHISAAECTLIRRIIFATGGHGPAAVSRFDAEMLFRVKDATLDCDNAPAWSQLFVDGVGNYLRGFTNPNAQLSHARMQELETFMNDTSVSTAQFFKRVAKAAPEVRNNFGKVFGQKSPPSGFAARQAVGDLVTDDEGNWLDGMIAANGRMDALESALLEEIAKDLT